MFMRFGLIEQGGETGFEGGLKQASGDSSLKNSPESRSGGIC
jgi:hypothetical protein